MSRRDIVTVFGMVVIAGLLLANLLRPTEPQAFTLPDAAGASVAVAAVGGDSAWVVAGDQVYFLSFKTRAEIKDRRISLIDQFALK